MKNNINEIAYNMNCLIEDDKYQEIFRSLPIKKASRQDLPLQNIFNKLISYSDILDKIGLSKSAGSVLQVISQMLEEGIDSSSMPPSALNEIAANEENTPEHPQDEVIV